MKWIVKYRSGGMTLPVEVEADDEEMAKMRAGIRRSEMLSFGRQRLPRVTNGIKWEIVSIELADSEKV